MGRNRVFAVALICAGVAALCALALPLVGSTDVSYSRAWAGISPDHEILFQIRLPRVLLALVAGGALALSGVLFQSLLRDALATPYTLGVSSGASLGAVTAICFGWRDIAGFNGIWTASFLGAVLTLLLVLGVASKQRRMSAFTLLLAGVTLNSMCMAAILFLHNVSTIGQSLAITRWLMGGIEAVELSTIVWLAAIVVPAAAVVFAHSSKWNLLAVGDEWAAVRGVATGRYMLIGYLISSLLTGAATALTGPIGFVGLIVPHALRLQLGADHRLLVPASLFVGAAFLALCDTVSRVAMAPAEIPVGVITAMLGGPFFIWLLRSR